MTAKERVLIYRRPDIAVMFNTCIELENNFPFLKNWLVREVTIRMDEVSEWPDVKEFFNLDGSANDETTV